MSAIFSFQLSRNERAIVDDMGRIGRPSISMAPSGDWRFIGLDRVTRGRSILVYTFDDIAHMLRSMPRDEFERLTEKLHVRDLDHGTVRSHGARVGPIWKAN